jgi:hypothetical protein
MSLFPSRSPWPKIPLLFREDHLKVCLDSLILKHAKIRGYFTALRWQSHLVFLLGDSKLRSSILSSTFSGATFKFTVADANPFRYLRHQVKNLSGTNCLISGLA